MSRLNDTNVALAKEIIAHCKAGLAAYKCPRSVDFMAELPRQPTGKLYKRLLRQTYIDAYRSARRES